jgi:predicted RNase H-like HicB family nuclease
MSHYIGIVRKDANSDFGISFPDFPGCITAGRTLDEAIAMAAKALALHIEGMVEDGEAIPDVSSAEAVMADPDNRDGTIAFVQAVFPAAKTMRVNITLPQDVLNDIDRYSEVHGLTRSGFLVTAAKQAMKRDAA